MKKFAIVFSGVIAICIVALLFVKLLKYFFGEIYYIDALGFILVCFYGFLENYLIVHDYYFLK